MADTMQTLGRGAQIIVALGVAYMLALWFVLVVWTYRDIEARSHNVLTQVFSTLLVVLFYVPGVLLYLMLRPKQSLDEAFQRSLEEEYLLQDLEELPLCGSCHRYVEDDFVLCPHCHVQLREGCPACARLIDLRWALCPYCGVSQLERETAVDRVETPAARWSAPALRRRRGTSEPRAVPLLPAALRQLPPGTQELAHAATAANTEETVSVPTGGQAREVKHLAVVSGMRAMARPFERFRSRGDERELVSSDVDKREDTDQQEATSGNGVVGHSQRLFGALNGSPSVGPRSDSVNGTTDWSTASSEPTAGEPNGHHPAIGVGEDVEQAATLPVKDGAVKTVTEKAPELVSGGTSRQ